MRNRFWYLALIFMIGIFGIVVAYGVMRQAPTSADEIGFKADPLPPTAEGQVILDAIKAEGYPSADKMSVELKARIIAAVNSGELKTIDSDTPGAGFNARLVGFSTSDQCEDQDVCLVVITNDKGTFVSHVIDNHGRPLPGRLSVGLGGFFGNDQYLITRVFWDGGIHGEVGYAVTIATGMSSRIATVDFPTPGASPARFEYEDHQIRLTIGEAVEANPPGAVMGSHMTLRSLKFVDEKGKTTELTREIISDEAEINPGSSGSVIIDYERTADSVYPVNPESGTDPLRPLMEFHDKGLYMWIYGGLYYYDPATGTIGLDLSQSP